MMANKKKARRRRSQKSKRSAKTQDLKFQAYLDSTYGISRGEIRNLTRSAGGSKRQARSISNKLRPRKNVRRDRY